MNYIINCVAMYVYNYYQTNVLIIIKIFYEIINLDFSDLFSGTKLTLNVMAKYELNWN